MPPFPPRTAVNITISFGMILLGSLGLLGLISSSQVLVVFVLVVGIVSATILIQSVRDRA